MKSFKFAFIFSLILSTECYSQEYLFGTPEVVTGDTFFLDDKLVHLEDIQVPDLGQKCLTEEYKKFPCGQYAKEELVNLISDNKIICKISRIEDNIYHSHCNVSGLGNSLNHEIVRYGWGYTENPVFDKAKEEAIINYRGIWAGNALYSGEFSPFN